MVTETTFDSIFDYGSAFKYYSKASIPKTINRNQYKSVFSYHSINIATDEDTDDVKEENWVSSILRKAITLLLYTLVIASFPLSFWICIKKIHALERIVLMRLGKLQPVRGPGFSFVLPLIDTWTRVDLRPQTFTVSTSQLTADKGIVEVQSEIEYQVSDIVSYVTKLSRQEKCLKDLSLYCLTNIISEKDVEDLENNKEYICRIFKHELNQASLKWGLEILNVYLYSVKVLKEAESMDALGTIMTAFKAVTDHTADHPTAIFSLILEDTLAKKKAPCAVPVEENEYVLDMLKKVLSAADGKSFAGDINGCFRFDIMGSTTKTVYCTFENGHTSLIDGPSCSLEPDVSVTMTEDNVRDFLENKISPIEAYRDGKVIVSGDWNLLWPLAKILEKPLCA